MEFMGIGSIAAIVVICYLGGLGVKLSPLDNKWIPLMCGILGGILGVVAMHVMPEFPGTDILTAIAIGIVSGLSATGIDQLGKQLAQDGYDGQHLE